MRCIRRETVNLLEGLLKPLDHMIQIRRKALKFVTRVNHRQAIAKVARSDLRSFLSNLVDRAQSAPHQDVSTPDRYRNNQGQPQRKGQQETTKNRLNLVIGRRDFNEELGTVSGLEGQAMEQQLMPIRHFDFAGELLRHR